MARFGVTVRPSNRRRVFTVKTPFSAEGVRVFPKGRDFALTRIVEADEIDQAEELVRTWTGLLTTAFAIQSGRHLGFSVTGASEIPKPGQTIARMSTSVQLFAGIARPINERAMKDAIKLVPLLGSLPRDDLCRRAAEWYAGGVEDEDVVDRFIDHWVALEIVSGMYQGHVDPSRCLGCGRVINARPSLSTIREFLGVLGLGERAPQLKGLAKVRGLLLHKGLTTYELSIKSEQLAELVKDCLLKLLHDRGASQTGNAGRPNGGDD